MSSRFDNLVSGVVSQRFPKTGEEMQSKLEKAKVELCRSIVQYPVQHCAFHWAMMISISLGVLLAGYFELNDLQAADFFIIEEQDVQNNLAFEGAKEQAIEQAEVLTPVRSENLRDFGVLYLYEPHNGALLTPKNIRDICRNEQVIRSQKDFSLFCGTEDAQGINTECNVDTLALSFVYYGPNFNESDCPELSEAEIEVRTAAVFANEQQFFFNKDPPTVARALVFTAGPLGEDTPPFKRFSELARAFGVDDQADDGYSILLEAFIEDVFSFFGVRDGPLRRGFEREFFRLDGSDVEIRIDGRYIETLRFREIISTDSLISAGSYCVVMIIVAFYLNSCFLSFISMMSILQSMFVGLFLFAIVLQIDYFTALNILVLFLIAGIGADNVLVLVDAWRQSEDEVRQTEAAAGGKEAGGDVSHYKLPTEEMSAEEEEEFLVKRLSYTYERAILSVANTSMTTFFAFLATAISPIDCISGLGLYAALVILVNFFFMFTVHPANLMMHHYLFVKIWPWPCLQKDDLLEGTQGEKDKDKDVSDEEEEEKQHWLDRGFEKYIILVNNTLFPHFFVVATTVIAITMFSSMLQLETPSELESNFQEDHMFNGFVDDFNNLFAEGTDDSFTLVTGVFGIRDLDTSGIPKYSGEDVQGEPIFDFTFDISQEATQDFVIEVCENLTELPCNLEGCSSPEGFLVRNEEVGSDVDCFMEAFRNFTAFTFIDIENDEAPQNLEEFNKLMVEFLNTTEGGEFADNVGFIDGRVAFVSLEYRMSMKQNQPLSIKEPVIDLFDDYADKVNRLARQRNIAGADTFFQTSFDHVWQHTEAAFVSGLYSGMAISLTLSFIVLFCTTRSMSVAFFAICGVGSIVASVLGTVQFMGWALGTAESIAGVFVIGLSVDYIVHLGHMFMHSRVFLEGIPVEEVPELNPIHKAFDCVTGEVEDEIYYTRDMVAFAVRKMGATVLAGAVTTFCSALFLSICTFAFFGKMSVLLLLTIFYAASYSFLLFIPLLRLFGPGSKQPGTSKQIKK